MPAVAPFTLLVVCTGNICRSPMAERLGEAYLAETLGDSAGIELVSAGTRAVVGSPMDPASARALEQLGGDPRDFRAGQLTEAVAARADLALTMTRAHRAAVLAHAPRAMARTFTLREAAGLLDLLGPVDDLPGEPRDRARALVTRMGTARSRRPSGPDDDIADPVGQDDDVHLRTASAIREALVPVLGGLARALDGSARGLSR